MSAVALIAVCAIQVDAAASNPVTEAGRRGLGVVLSTGKAVYRQGEPVRMALTVFNHSAEPVHLEFRTSQRYDFVIEDGKGREVWRWSEGRLFTQALGEEILGPETPRRTYETAFDGELAPGTYTVTGLVTAETRRISASLTIALAP